MVFPQISFSSLLLYIPLIFSAVMLGAIAFVFVRHRAQLSRYAVRLAISIIVFRIGYAILLSALQYAAWQSNSFSQYLLPPHQPMSYFLFYSGMHFWLYPTLSFFAAALVLLFFGVLRGVKAAWFLQGEIALGILLALILGWPLSLFLVPMSFVALAAISAVCIFMKREQPFSLGVIMLGFGGTLFISGMFFIHLLHLEALYV